MALTQHERRQRMDERNRLHRMYQSIATFLFRDDLLKPHQKKRLHKLAKLTGARCRELGIELGLHE